MARNPLQQSSPPSMLRMSHVMDMQAFADAIEDSGVRLVHFKSMPCPIGQVDQYDPRKAHHVHAGCYNGFIYERAGECKALFMGNSHEATVIEVGRYDGSTVSVTFPPTYTESDKPLIVGINDRFALVEPQGYVVGKQRFTASATAVDSLQFPAEAVEMLMDADGGRYKEQTDFLVRGGDIHWVGPHRPSPGAVCSARYLYLPFWYVGRLVHEIRVAMSADPITGERSIRRYPYSAVLHRENFGRDEASDTASVLKQRHIPSPDDHESAVLA